MISLRTPRSEPRKLRGSLTWSHRDPGKQSGVWRGPLLQFSRCAIADCRAYGTAGYDGSDHAERRREHARLRFLVLPPCFPGSDVWGGEATNRPEGPLEVIDFLKKNWSGRRDSNPRPQPWQGCALPLSYTRIRAASPPRRAYGAGTTRMQLPSDESLTQKCPSRAAPRTRP